MSLLFLFFPLLSFYGMSVQFTRIVDNGREKNWNRVKRTIMPSMETNTRLTRPLHSMRCVSLVGHTSFADHSIRRSRKPWRDMTWQKQAGIALTCHAMCARVSSQDHVSYPRNAAEWFLTFAQVKSINAQIYMRNGERRAKILLYNRISSSNRIPRFRVGDFEPSSKELFFTLIFVYSLLL